MPPRHAIASLLCAMLSATMAGTELVRDQQSRSCLGDAHVRTQIGHPPTIRLSSRKWISHKRMTYIVEILLREKLGYRVEVHDLAESMDEAYTVISEGKADFDVEMWPSSDPVAFERAIDVHKTPNNFVDMGELGVKARSGWFLRTVLVRRAADASGTQLFQWMSLATLEQIDAFNGSAANPTHLMTSDFIVKFPPLGLLPSLHASSMCCSQADIRNTTCTPGMGACTIVATANPKFDPGENEKRAAMSGLPIEVVHANEQILATMSSAAVAGYTGVESPLCVGEQRLYPFEPGR